MADFLEDLDSNDTNRIIDRFDFMVHQFQIFTHDYRENTKPFCQDKDDENHSTCKQEKEKSRQSKKNLINITRKLQKALFSLELMADNNDALVLLEDIRSVNSHLHTVIGKTEAEFSATSIPLPNFDTIDMKCFLGDDQV
uniref:Uncharacterized protein n=1 Tax=Caenorhabditis japonica TaxID=281687 RepID=A0A8R1IHP0_CAEJA